jgi:GNAT superfamily N-acetyltransferase
MITYRLATASDAARVVSLLEEIMQLHGVTPPESAHLHATVAAILGAPDHLLLVAEPTDHLGEDRVGEDHLVGMCALIFSQSTWSASPVCELQDVVVTESSRRSDVGRGLVRAAEEIARGRGCSRLFLLAEYWNLGAHAFYRSLGLAEKTCLYFERDLRAAPPT